MRIEGSNLAASNFNLQVSFRASLSLREVRRKFLRKVRAEEKESKNLFAVIRAEEKEKSTHHSSRNRAVAVGERREEEKKRRKKEASFEASILCV